MDVLLILSVKYYLSWFITAVEQGTEGIIKHVLHLNLYCVEVIYFSIIQTMQEFTIFILLGDFLP